MYDLEIHFDDRPGQLARMGEALGAAGHSVEGGGMWVVADTGVAHFLFAIEVLYSDHDHQLILVVDDKQFDEATAVSLAWSA